MPNLFNPGDWVVTRMSLPGIALLTPCQIDRLDRLAPGESPVYAVVSMDGVEAKIPHHLLRSANEPRFHPVKREERVKSLAHLYNHYTPKREENPMHGYITARCPHTHVEIKGERYEIKYTLSEAPYIVVNDARMVRLTTLDTLGVEYKMITPDPFNDLEPGLYVGTWERTEGGVNHRVYRKTTTGGWQFADVDAARYVPFAAHQTPDSFARILFGKGLLTRIHPAGV